MKPTAATSKLSIATTRKQSVMTSFWNTETVLPLMMSWTSMLRVSGILKFSSRRFV